MKLRLLLLPLLLACSTAPAADLLSIPVRNIEGEPVSLKDYEGKVLLIVNVASKCGLTKQYAALQKLHETYSSRGLIVLGFPANDFNQERGSNEEIAQFCSSRFAVTFPLFEKIAVKGPDQHPLYAALTGPEAPFPGDVRWNFAKFLIARDGNVAARFDPRTTPDDPEVVAAIEKLLGPSTP